MAIHVGDTDIYADSAQYNSRAHEIMADGHVRIYRDHPVSISPTHGVYNIDTKKLARAHADFEYKPYFLSGKSVTRIYAEQLSA